ncbi:MAG: mannose-6-phosphate isomerase [Candidatus Petromonas sp.]|jgi:mannose-6-phosphate isomerase|nr:mannose-6-phosphate isomerase [Candidatus Petromonas sp.]
MYSIKFEPVFKEKVWGGNKLAKYLSKDVSMDVKVGESWEIACHREGTSKIRNGEYKGLTLEELIKHYGDIVFGKSIEKITDRFPLLIKFIDANDKLSVQVHPDDEYAMKFEDDFGKTEMWYIVDAEPGAKLVYGLKKGITKEDFIKAIENNDFDEILREIEVKKGDVVFIPAGTIHAIGKGILIAEIQQSSDITYRVYDWNRVGLDGKPRELHIEKALDVINFDEYIEKPKVESTILHKDGYKKVNYVSCKYFNIEILDVDKHYKNNMNEEEFEIYLCVDGEFNIEYGRANLESFKKGETILMPANIGDFIIKGKGRIIRVYL